MDRRAIHAQTSQVVSDATPCTTVERTSIKRIGTSRSKISEVQRTAEFEFTLAEMCYPPLKLMLLLMSIRV